MLQEPQTKPEDLEKLYIASHTLAGTSASYGFPQFSEVAAKMAHIFHYAMNATLTAGYARPADRIYFRRNFRARIRSAADQLQRHGDRRRHRGFQAALFFCVSGRAGLARCSEAAAAEVAGRANPLPTRRLRYSFADASAAGWRRARRKSWNSSFPKPRSICRPSPNVCSRSKANPNADDINRLFRSMHTVKGSAAQVGSASAFGCCASRGGSDRPLARWRSCKPSAEIVDICLQSVDVLKKFLHRQWPATPKWRAAVDPLLAQIAELAPEEVAEEAAPARSAPASSTDAATAETARCAARARRSSCSGASACRRPSPCAFRSSGWTA